VDFPDSPYINFKDLMEEVNANRVESMQREEAFNGFEDYLKHRSGEVNITKDELDLLLNSRKKGIMELGMMNTSFLKFGKLQEETSRIAMLLESPKKVQEPKIIEINSVFGIKNGNSIH